MKHQDKVEDGIGFYSQAEVSRILAVRTASISRWLKGSTKAGTFYPPLWKPKLIDERGTVFLSFRDLIETLVTSDHKARFILGEDFFVRNTDELLQVQQ